MRGDHEGNNVVQCMPISFSIHKKLYEDLGAGEQGGVHHLSNTSMICKTVTNIIKLG